MSDGTVPPDIDPQRLREANTAQTFAVELERYAVEWIEFVLRHLRDPSPYPLDEILAHPMVEDDRPGWDEQMTPRLHEGTLRFPLKTGEVVELFSYSGETRFARPLLVHEFEKEHL